jgi:hypothetical protein
MVRLFIERRHNQPSLWRSLAQAVDAAGRGGWTRNKRIARRAGERYAFPVNQ